MLTLLALAPLCTSFVFNPHRDFTRARDVYSFKDQVDYELSKMSTSRDMDEFAGLRAIVDEISDSLKPNENNVTIIKPYAKYVLSLEENIFGEKVNHTRDVMNARREATRELEELSTRLHVLKKTEADRLRLLKEVVRRRDQKLSLSNSKREAYARELQEENLDAYLNLDEACTINSVIEAVSQISETYWLGQDKVSQELHASSMTNEKVKSANKLRALVGPEFEEVENGKIGWFPPRIFMTAMLMKMETLRKAATAMIQLNEGRAVPRAMIPLVATEPTSIIDLLARNRIKLVSLPPVIIINILWNMKSWTKYEEEITLSDTAGGTGRYVLKSVVSSYYGFHTDHTNPTEESSPGHSPDILIYEHE